MLHSTKTNRETDCGQTIYLNVRCVSRWTLVDYVKSIGKRNISAMCLRVAREYTEAAKKGAGQ
jgi:hypothetical protein